MPLAYHSPVFSGTKKLRPQGFLCVYGIIEAVSFVTHSKWDVKLLIVILVIMGITKSYDIDKENFLDIFFFFYIVVGIKSFYIIFL